MSLLAKQHKAHGRVRRLVAKGVLVRPDTCSRCGAQPPPLKGGRPPIQGHHHKGYDFPDDVEWLCVACHREETPCNPKRGSDVVNSKLTEAEVSAIIASTESYRVVARRFGVHPTYVRRLRLGTDWAWFDPGAPRHPKVRTIGYRRLSPDEVTRLRQWIADGVTNTEIAKTLGITEAAVRQRRRALIFGEPKTGKQDDE